MTDPIQNYLDSVRALVARFGHAVQSVADCGGPQFSYTVGIAAHHGYELLTIGLPPRVANQILNDLAAKLAEQPIADGEDIHGLADGFSMRLKTHRVVDPGNRIDRTNLVSISLRLGYHVPYVRQLVWPDVLGRFPDEPGYNHPNRQSIDLLAPQFTAH